MIISDILSYHDGIFDHNNNYVITLIANNHKYIGPNESTH